jgi:hypothetical protein
MGESDAGRAGVGNFILALGKETVKGKRVTMGKRGEMTVERVTRREWC